MFYTFLKQEVYKKFYKLLKQSKVEQASERFEKSFIKLLKKGKVKQASKYEKFYKLFKATKYKKF